MSSGSGNQSLGYMGLGDLFVLVFFGPVAVGGTYFVQALEVPPEPSAGESTSQKSHARHLHISQCESRKNSEQKASHCSKRESSGRNESHGTPWRQ